MNVSSDSFKDILPGTLEIPHGIPSEALPGILSKHIFKIPLKTPP